MKKVLKQSETRVILRSQITLNPINPKRHVADVVKLQKKNLQKVGYLGGIVWNETTGNIIDGHRRIYAMDDYYGYDGTKDTDYEIKVEVVSLDEKTEKEQLTYMAVGGTKADIDLIAEYIGDIDYSDIGLPDDVISDILSMTQDGIEVTTEILDFDDTGSIQNVQKSEENPTATPATTYEDKKEHMKQVKKQVKETAVQEQLDDEAYIILSFSSYRNKTDFCQMISIAPESRYAKGEEVTRMIE